MKVFKLTLVLAGVLSMTSGFAASNFDAELEVAAIPQFELAWMNHADGPQTLWRSADHADAIYVVEAYFKNCPYCNDNAPLVDKLVDDYAAQTRVKVLDVGRDCRDSDYRSWISSHQPNHPVLNDCGMKVLGPLSISGYPTTVVLDCNLNEVGRVVGGWDSGDARKVRQLIDEQLAKDCPHQ